MEQIKKYLNSLNSRQLIVLKYMVSTKEGKEILSWYFHNSSEKPKQFRKKI